MLETLLDINFILIILGIVGAQLGDKIIAEYTSGAIVILSLIITLSHGLYKLAYTIINIGN